MVKMPQRINKQFLKTGGMSPIKGCVIHNDYGSSNATAKWYLNSFLPSHNLEQGVAHYYIDKDTIGRAVDTYRIAWHTANQEGNGHYIGYEVCGSRWDNGLSTDDFKQNEEMVFRQVAEDMLFYKIPVNRNTVRLHKEFTSTSCPHRSWDLHGKSINAVKDYFISRIKHYQKLGKTVDEMIDAENKGAKDNPHEVDVKNIKPINEVFVLADYATAYASGVKISDKVKGKTFKADQVGDFKKSKSNKAYRLIDGKWAIGWVLEQDLLPVKVSKNQPKEESKVKLADNEVLLDGIVYTINKK